MRNSVDKAAAIPGLRLNHARDPVFWDRSEGFSPFCVVGSAGTVITGVIDPLDELAEKMASSTKNN